MAQGIFYGRFRSIYSIVKVTTIYVGTYFVFYFWPQFLGKVVVPDYAAQMQVIAGSLLTPLGFLGVGGYFGKKVFGFHILLLVALVATTWFLWPQDLLLDPPALHDRFTPVMIFGYALGCILGYREELKCAPIYR